MGSVDSRPWDGWGNPPGNTGVSRFLANINGVLLFDLEMRETACSHRVNRSHRSNRPWAAKSIPHTGSSCGGTHPSHTFNMEFLRWAYTLYPNHHHPPLPPPPPPPPPRCIHLYYDIYIWSVVCCHVQISSRVALGLTLTILGICSVTLILYMFDTHA